MNNPRDAKYTKDHEWVRMDGDVAVMGIADYAQSQLGDIVFVDLPKVGAEIEAGKAFGAVESVKAASDLFSPVTGTVAEVNSELTQAPEKINADAHGAWMIKVTLKNTGEVNGLLSAADYEKLVSEKAAH